MTPLHLCLLISTGLFGIGLAGALARSNSILVLLGIELMLNVIFVIFSIAIAAAEAAVGLALIIALYRHQRNIRLQDANTLKG